MVMKSKTWIKEFGRTLSLSPPCTPDPLSASVTNSPEDSGLLVLEYKKNDLGVVLDVREEQNI